MNAESQFEHKKENMYSIAQELREKHPHDEDFIVSVGRYLVNRWYELPDLQTEPNSILESRFTPAEEAFEKRMMSCGILASMMAAMLRHGGLQVKLVHGEWAESVDHAWISVLDKEKGEWVDYDFTRDKPRSLPTHVEKTRTDSWEDIREQILHDHETLKERILARRNKSSL